MQALVLVLDLIGTFVFALAGATTGVRRQLDLFGVLVLCSPPRPRAGSRAMR
jgi:uncharacterized membrane protein YeiH